jgi:dTDP-4-amino-4,6-dideoxygalactose transaminase
VIVPSYICPGVIEAVEAAGLRPVPCDIGPDFNIDPEALEDLFSARTLAVIAAHMYGCPARIREIEAICRQRGVFLVDDSAQVTGVSVCGQPLGTFGDIGVVSFSQSKTIVAGCHNAGGLLIVNNSQLEPPIIEAYAALPEARGCITDFVTFFWNYILAEWTETPSYYFARIFRPVAKPSVAKFETATRMNNVVAVLALEQLKSLQKRIAGRRRIVELYHRKVASQRTVGFPQYAPGRYLTRIMLTLPRGANVTKIRTDLFRKGVRTRSGYPVFTSQLAPRPERALNMQPRLIELPSRSAMPAETVNQIWRAFDASVGSFETERAAYGAFRPDGTYSVR